MPSMGAEPRTSSVGTEGDHRRKTESGMEKVFVTSACRDRHLKNAFIRSPFRSSDDLTPVTSESDEGNIIDLESADFFP